MKEVFLCEKINCVTDFVFFLQIIQDLGADIVVVFAGGQVLT